MGSLDGKNAIITGANRGLGKALVEALTREGCNVWAVARKPSDEFDVFISGIRKNNNVRITPIYADLSSEESIKNAYNIINSENRSIDVLINNAGVGHMGWLQLTKTNFIKQLYAVNVFAPMILSQLVLRKMLRRQLPVRSMREIQFTDHQKLHW